MSWTAYRTCFGVFMTTILVSLSVPVSAQEVRLQGIVVTGELIDRPLQETGTSVEVLTEEDLENRPGLDSAIDVLEQTPNVNVLNGSAFAPTVRGVDGTGPTFALFAYFAGTRPRLNYQLDGRTVNYTELIDGDTGIWDLDRIEVLRGPQSTITGRNSIAGTVLIETKDPTFETEGAAQIAAGNYDRRRFSVMANTPIFPDLMAVRLTADWVNYSSTVNFQPFLNVDDPEDKKYLNLRGKVLFTPNIGENTKLLLNFNHIKNKRPNSERVARPFEERVASFAQQPVHTTTTNSIGTEFSTALSNTITFDVNSNYSDFNLDRNAVLQGGPATIDTREFVIEPKITYKDTAGFSAVAGIYHHRIRQDELINVVVDNIFDDKTDTFAAYAEGIIPLSSQFDLLVGGRYERENRSRVGGDAGPFVDIDYDETFEAFLPKAGLTWHPTKSMSYGIQVARGFNAGGAGVAFGPMLFPVQPYEYDEEYVWNYELFGRQTFANGRIRTTQNIFFSDYKDMQLPFEIDPTDANPFDIVVRNFEKVRTYGAELGVAAQITDVLTLYGNVGLLQTEIVKSSGSAALEGNDLQRAPNLTANVGVIWKDGNWRASASARYSDAYFSDIDNRPRGKVDPFVIADAELAYDFGGAEVFGSVKNIFDHDQNIALFANGANPNLDAAIRQQPRTFWAGIKMRY